MVNSARARSENAPSSSKKETGKEQAKTAEQKERLAKAKERRAEDARKTLFEGIVLERANSIGAGDTVERMSANGLREAWDIVGNAGNEDVILREHNPIDPEFPRTLYMDDRALAQELLVAEEASGMEMYWDEALGELQDPSWEAVKLSALAAAGKESIELQAQGQKVDGTRKIEILRKKVDEEILDRESFAQRNKDASAVAMLEAKLDNNSADDLKLLSSPKTKERPNYKVEIIDDEEPADPAAQDLFTVESKKKEGTSYLDQSIEDTLPELTDKDIEILPADEQIEAIEDEQDGDTAIDANDGKKKHNSLFVKPTRVPGKNDYHSQAEIDDMGFEIEEPETPPHTPKRKVEVVSKPFESVRDNSRRLAEENRAEANAVTAKKAESVRESREAAKKASEALRQEKIAEHQKLMAEALKGDYVAPEKVEEVYKDVAPHWANEADKLAERYQARGVTSVGDTLKGEADLSDNFFVRGEVSAALDNPTANFLEISESITNDREGFVKQFEELREAGYLKHADGSDITLKDLMEAKNPIPFSWAFNKKRFNTSTDGYAQIIKKAIKRAAGK